MMFSPSPPCKNSLVYQGLLPVATMTSADFFPCTRHRKISLGKVNIPVSKPAISTISVLSPFRAWDFGMMCYLIRPNSLCIWFLFVSSDTAVWLICPSGLQCMDHPKPPCHLLGFRAQPVPHLMREPQRLRDFHPLEHSNS